MGNRNLTVPLFGFLTFGALLSASKPQVGASISGEAKLPSDLGGKMPPSFDQDVARVVEDIDRIEADTLSQIEHTALDRQGQVRTLGKLLIFDKHLSVNIGGNTKTAGFSRSATKPNPGALPTRPLVLLVLLLFEPDLTVF